MLKSSLSDPQREVVLVALEKAMNGLGNLYVALHTEAVVDTAKVADQVHVGLVLTDHAALVEKAVAEILQGVEKRDPMNLLVEEARGSQKWMGTEIEGAPEDAREQLVSKAAEAGGRVVEIMKAASMFRQRTNWELPDGDPKKYMVIKEFAPEPTVQVAFFGSRMEAENDALRRNVEAVTTVSKALAADPAAGGDAGTDGGVTKVGAPMKADRLNRLKGAITMLKDALGDLQSGSTSMEKFKKASAVLGALVTELSKSATVQRGLTDDNDGDPGSPNQGSGQQPDSTAVEGVEGIVGEGVPAGVTEVIKQLKADQVALTKRLEEQESAAVELRKQNKKLRKRRAAPSTIPADVGKQGTGGGDAQGQPVSWPMDMNDFTPDA